MNKNITTTNCATLMNHFKALFMIEFSNDLIAKVLDADTCLNGVSTIQGAFGSEQKV